VTTAAPVEAAAELRPIQPLAYGLARLLLELVFRTYIRTSVSGREHLPPAGTPTLVAANHTSSLDAFAAGFAVGRPGHFIAKVEATRIPLFGPFLLACGAIPAARDGKDTQVLRAALAALEDGRLMGVAPEGTRSRDGRLGPYDPGFVWLAAKTGAVVVPCALHGAWNLMPKGAGYPRPGRMWIRFGPGLRPADEGRRLARARMDELAEEVRQRTLAMLADLVAESGVPNPAVDGAGGAP
jgi:1-acyl-sn-glycerol-3-phosphate acyltransferase